MAAGAVVSLVVFGCARIVISWFPMDAPGAERTAHGTAHWLLAVVTFAAITSAAFELRHALSAATPPDHSHIAGLVHWLSWLLLVAVSTSSMRLASRLISCAVCSSTDMSTSSDHAAR